MSQNVLKVSQLLLLAKDTIDQNLQLHHILVVGELSNFTAHRSGHWYFSLKDTQGKLNSVMFSTQNKKIGFQPKDGDKVILQGSLSVFSLTGQLQFVATSMTLDGIGRYFIEFERRKKMLSDAGFFNDKYKKALPKYPFSIGVIVGDKSAAQADIHKVIAQRWPVATVFDYLSLVQGENAPAQLIESCLKADINNHDIILIARGGGSIEDLWAFNNIELVQTIFKMKTPIISGVGHEVDTTLIDYVCDLRAPTPTAAAQYATPDLNEVYTSLNEYQERYNRLALLKLNQAKSNLLFYQERRVFQEPLSLLMATQVKLDYYDNQLFQFKRHFKQISVGLHQNNLLFYARMIQKINQYKSVKNIHLTQQKDLLQKCFLKKQQDVNMLMVRLDLLSPLKIMSQGYALTYRKDKLIKDIQEIEIGDDVTILYKDGKIDTKVISKESNNEGNNI